MSSLRRAATPALGAIARVGLAAASPASSPAPRLAAIHTPSLLLQLTRARYAHARAGPVASPILSRALSLSHRRLDASKPPPPPPSNTGNIPPAPSTSTSNSVSKAAAAAGAGAFDAAAKAASSSSSSSGIPDPTQYRRIGFVRRFITRYAFVKYTFFACGSIVFGLAATVLLILAYDYTTYREEHVKDVPTAPLALKPNPGGPKNLPIIESYVDDWQDEESRAYCEKERLVIVGGGWGAVGVIQHLDPKKYNVTLVSPSNFYLFSPLLPSAIVGTVEPRTLVEPIRRILRRVHGHYIQGRAVDVVLPSSIHEDANGQKLLEVEVIDAPEESSDPQAKPKGRSVYVPYDKLIIACGSVTNDHGVPGLEHCFQLKTIKDARAIRGRILDNLEIAALPTTSEAERERLLSFVICGGGPTGVEAASEIYDMVSEDVLKEYPKLLRAKTKVRVIQSREHVLNTYSEKISEYAERKFLHDGLDVIVNSRVKEVERDRVHYTVRNPATNEVTEVEVPSGLTLWTTGVAMNPFVKRLVSVLPNQFHLKGLQVDSHLRVKGAPEGSMYAVGDASTIDNRLIDHLYEWVERFDTNKDGVISYPEFCALAHDIGREFPLAGRHFEKLDKMFAQHDSDNDGELRLNELAEMLIKVQSNLTSLPATAQVAAQQGKYLAKKLNKLAKLRDTTTTTTAGMQKEQQPSKFTKDEEIAKPFAYHDLGSLAYIGNAAAFDIPFLPDGVGQFAGGSSPCTPGAASSE